MRPDLHTPAKERRSSCGRTERRFAFALESQCVSGGCPSIVGSKGSVRRQRLAAAGQSCSADARYRAAPAM
jgi:hypothetical protein